MNRVGPALFFGGLLNVLIGLLHLVIIFYGAEGYRYFGAGETMATMDEARSIVPALVTLAVTFVFFVFAAFAFSAVGTIKKLPATKQVLVAISVIFTLRGLAIFVETYFYLTDNSIPARHIIFSLVALVTGLLYASGAIQYIKAATKG